MANATSLAASPYISLINSGTQLQQQQPLFSFVTPNLTSNLNMVPQPATSMCVASTQMGAVVTSTSLTCPTTNTISVPVLPQPTFINHPGSQQTFSLQPLPATPTSSCASTASTTASFISTSANTPSTVSIVQSTSTSSSPCLSTSSSSPMAHLVQDPVTGLYNLVQTSQTITTPSTVGLSRPLAASTPGVSASAYAQPVTLAAVSSPKRSCATPLKSAVNNVGSPAKAAKLQLPLFSSTNFQDGGRSAGEGADPTPSATPTTKFMCGVCNKYFGNTKNLRVHISEIHEGKRGQFPCDVCGKVFPRKRNMERHKNALHLKTNPRCALCEKVVVNLDMHIKRFHRASEDSPGKIHNIEDA
jgi:Zinc finger, C2H2 type